MANTVLKVGWTDPLNDTFGAHPRLGAVLDLNDGVTFTLATLEGIELPPPPRTLVTAGNIRTQGEAATRAIYRHNRCAVARVLVGPMGSYGDLVTNIRALVSWLVAPPNVPFSIQYQPIGASSPVYLDVVGAAHDIPEDEGQWLRLQFEPVELVFLCRPGLRGDRVMLSNPVQHRYAWRYLVGFIHPGSGRTSFHLATSVSNSLFEVGLAAFARQADAGPAKQIVLVLDRAGWHTSAKLRVPEHAHLLFLPPYSPELQPAEHLWPLTNAALANRHFASIEELEDAQLAHCAALQRTPDRIRSTTQFHWWPKQIHKRRGPRRN